ncbi:MAG: indolepyruvate oxidoreductase subunit beta family protein [Alphaproteobacteria bacterium]|nr:indolepyruvate oxidoreductase subunit beta family protein [Alphaproteobacteria bacterium]
MARSTTRPITVAIMALGGQGGGVMADWTVRIGELAGFRAQYTSVQGVAQRTGATIYYIELFPEAEIAARQREPVLALMPVPGDVDVVVASELMEAGRAIVRGFVTPDRTTLIASSHRVYAISEKIAMADGRADSGAVHEAAQAAAKQWIAFDMDEIAREGGSVISAVMFGALAGSGALPIPREVFETVIRESGKAVEANLRTFTLGFDRACGEGLPAAPAAEPPSSASPAADAVRPLLARIEEELPYVAREFAIEGLRRTIDYQSPAYGALYLDRLRDVAHWDADAGGSAQRHNLVREAARHLALWMTFEDTYRVADLKTRDSRFQRFRAEIKAAPDQILAVTEFMHPRLTEVADSLPAGLGRWAARQGWLERFFAKGRKVRTSSLRGFLMLSLLASGRRWRRLTLRFQREDAAIEAWLDTVRGLASTDYAAAVELVRCQKLIRGYGETHERGARNFGRIVEAIASAPAPGLAPTIRKLRDAALADEKGAKLEKALAELA